MANELFSSTMIATMQREYGKIAKVDPALPTYAKLCKTIDNMTDAQLRQVKDAGIKWLSSLALNRCIRRGIA